ncbi:unnamed protein product [Urochloa decumbens]|uniref:Receptor kinase-like protein Xa21 n=1 Tax=Urochloa decumbens TaxID=240449 RepID=A0ABC8VCF1_9POAL
MAVRATSLLLLMMLCTSTSTIEATEEADEEAALLDFRAAAVSGGGNGGSLPSWNGSSAGGFCSWEGVTCGARHRRVVAITLPSQGLTGVLSPAIGNLSFLRTLNLSSNSFTGDIPASLGRLRRLRALDLSHNAFSDPWMCTIPPGLGSILGLRFLALAYNNLSGKPPISLYNLSSLEILQIQGNMLLGDIPADIGSRFPRMRILCFDRNQFTGFIPASISNLTALEALYLEDNRLSGYVPRTLGRLGALQNLYLHYNMLEADNREGWEFINSLSNCSQLQELQINRNPGFTGNRPSSIVNLSRTLQVLWLSDTGITGNIPSAIGNLVNLEFFIAANTSLSGVVPNSIGKMGNLVQLGLYNTRLSGPIPSVIGNLSKLTKLFAYNTNLEGAIPASLGKLKNLEAIDLSRNLLNNSIPRDILKLPLLSDFLELSYNSLSGPLPSEVGSLQNLNQLFLSGNQLSGEIPDSIGKCTVLENLWLDDNSFTGSIPQTLKNVKGLNQLNLSMNKLSGTIPDGIGNIQRLQQLDLAHNNFSGPIPTILQNLTLLTKLDLSFNNFQGEVPKEGIFRNLADFSITGNDQLCGGIPQLHLATCHVNSVKKKRNERSKYLIIDLATSAALLFLAFIIALIKLIYKKLRQKQNRLSLPPMIEEQYGRVSYRALANGTNGFSEGNLLGKGSFGAVYTCTFQDEGIIAAVKVFNLEQSGSSRSFVAECEALRRVRHRCLLKIITCCSSINQQGQEFKALVFELMPNGSLNAWLHPEPGMPTMSNTLSLAQRLDIAVDILDALDYLHNHCQPPIVHCDLKPSNILLAEDLSARVGDFGISRILREHASATLQNSNSTIRIRGTIGYVAPEYGEGASASTLGDVYSLGILLLEMFTGQSPIDDMFRGSLDLHKFSDDALPERIWEIADTTMWLHMDTNDRTARSKIEKCLISVIALGISCSKKQPRERTPIHDAVIEMHAIRDSYLQFARSLVAEHGGSSNNSAAIYSKNN